MFNKSKPYGVVHGESEARFYQNGKHYNAEGSEINIKTGKVLVKAAKPDATLPPTQTNDTPDFMGIGPAPTAPTAPTTPTTPTTPTAPAKENMVDLDSLSWQKIRKMVESSGGVYHNIEQAKAYLRSI